MLSGARGGSALSVGMGNRVCACRGLKAEYDSEETAKTKKKKKRVEQRTGKRERACVRDREGEGERGKRGVGGDG